MRFLAHLRIATLPLLAACLVTALPAHAGAQKSHKGTAVAFPWAFQKGTDTARATAATTVAEIAQKAGYDVVASDKAASAWNDSKLKLPAYGRHRAALCSRSSARPLAPTWCFTARSNGTPAASG